MKSHEARRLSQVVDPTRVPALSFSPLRIEEFRSPCLNQPVTTWTDEDGLPIGRAALEGSLCWIELDGVGVYRFPLVSGGVEVAPASKGRRDFVVDSYLRSVLPHVLQARGTQVLHASAVVVGEGVLGLCGVSGVGKSTLALGLAGRGYLPWADDALIVDPGESGGVSFRLPFSFRLQDRVVEEAKSSGGDETLSPVGWRGIRALVLLRRIEASEAEDSFLWDRLAPAQAFQALLSHAYWLDVGDTVLRRRMIETYLSITDTVPIIDCAFAPDLGNLERLIDKVEVAVNEI